MNASWTLPIWRVLAIAERRDREWREPHAVRAERRVDSPCHGDQADGDHQQVQCEPEAAEVEKVGREPLQQPRDRQEGRRILVRVDTERPEHARIPRSGRLDLRERVERVVVDVRDLRHRTSRDVVGRHARVLDQEPVAWEQRPAGSGRDHDEDGQAKQHGAGRKRAQDEERLERHRHCVEGRALRSQGQNGRRRGDEGGHDGRYEPAGHERRGRGEDDQAGEQRHGEVHGEHERASARGQ